jgi:hypothetical protein
MLRHKRESSSANHNQVAKHRYSRQYAVAVCVCVCVCRRVGRRAGVRVHVKVEVCVWGGAIVAGVGVGHSGAVFMLVVLQS